MRYGALVAWVVYSVLYYSSNAGGQTASEYCTVTMLLSRSQIHDASPALRRGPWVWMVHIMDAQSRQYLAKLGTAQ